MNPIEEYPGSVQTFEHPLADPPAPRRLVVWTAGAALLGGVFLVGHLARPFGRPAQTVKKTLEALSSGDAERLRAEDRLGFRQQAEREIRRRGEAEYARVLGIFDREATLGDREYRRIRKKVADLGQGEFRHLGRDEQRTIREASRRQFVSDKGWAALSDDERKQVGSADVLGDRAKLRARAISAGLPTLAPEVQAAAQGVDLAAPETAKDRKLAKIANQAERAGYEELAEALQSAEAAASIELGKLTRRERDLVENGTFYRWLFEHGLKAADDKTRAKANLTQLLDDDAPEAWALRRQFGYKDLDPESRKQLDGLDYDRFVAARRAFIDQQGVRLWGEKLRETFNAGCCSTTTVRYLGESARSLARNTTATVALEFGPPPPKPVKKDKEQRAASDDESETIHPARRYLGERVTLGYRWGTWGIVGFGGGPGEESIAKNGADAVKAVLGSLSSLAGGGLSGVVLIALAGVVLFLLVRRRSDGSRLSAIELAAGGATLALAALQIAFEGQLSLDDVWFTPLYLALPIWVGFRRGARAGIVAGFLGGLGLVVAASVAALPSWATGAEALPTGEYLLATIFLATTGALAGRVRWPAELAIALPLAWVLFFAVVDRSQLASLTLYAHLCLAVAVTGLGLLLNGIGVVRSVARVFDPDAV